MATSVIGIDLAAQPAATALVELRWSGVEVIVSRVQLGCVDAQLVEETLAADVVGIDAPFGWPVPFVDAVSAWSSGRGWPMDVAPADLRLRRTDLEAARVKSPLSASMDKLGSCAARCARVLDEAGRSLGHPVDRAHGSDGIYEVYPAAALRQWCAHTRASYKRGDGARATREVFLGELVAALSGFDLCAHREVLLATDHAFDGLLSALVAAAAHARCTIPIPDDADHDVVAVEGWLHVPQHGSLEALGRHAFT